MKIGTDSVLLGAGAVPWQPPAAVLDIGTGSGVVALMLAQRFPHAHITGLEIDEAAAAQALENVSVSPFADRVTVVQADIRVWQPVDRFDWIVTNPPFHLEDKAAPEWQRQQARQAGLLPPEVLAEQVARLLSPGGTFSLIAPEAYLQKMAGEMASHLIWRWQQLDIYAAAGKPLLRQLVSFTGMAPALATSYLCIHQPDGQYTADYRRLTAEFYL